MTLYDLDFPKIKIKFPKFWKNKNFWIFSSIIFTSSFFGFIAGIISGSVFYFDAKDYLSRLDLDVSEQEEKIIKVVNDVSPAVVSIIITKDLPIFEEYYINPFGGFDFLIPQQRQVGTKKQEIGGGTGFMVSEDGMIITNKHVVLDEDADYTVLTNDARKFSAKVLARDPVQDLAVLKIETENSISGSGELIKKPFPVVKLGDSDKLQMGQTVIAIGNALGEFRNTISVGVISGLGRTITASGGSFVETIEDVIQTDAAINKGNSGGPLLNLKGEVVGINTATVLEAQSIGFAIPVNKAKKDIEQIKSSGEIVYPFLGIRYVIITENIQKENDLLVSYGAWIAGGRGESAIVVGSAADKAGLKENDIILEFNGKKITAENSLAKVILKYKPGDSVALKVLRAEKELTLQATLDSRSK